MSGTSEPVFFLDRNLGRKTVPIALREAGFAVEVMDDHFPPRTVDQVWLEEVGRRGWVAVTLDEKSRSRHAEQTVVRRFRVGLFLLVRWKGSTGPTMAAAIVKARGAMLRIAGREPRPFIAKIYGDGRVMVWLRWPKVQRQRT